MKLQDIGREDELEQLNRSALRMARQVADDSGALMAGGLCTTHNYRQDDEAETEAIFKVRK